MTRPAKRAYASAVRADAAEATRKAVLTAARTLFSRRGIDAVTIAQIADKAGVASSTVYALFKSKEGILRALLQTAIFGPRFQEAQSMVQGVADPAEAIARTAQISRAIYESESAEVGLLRGASGFSPALRKLEEEFETVRFEMQEPRLKALWKGGRTRRGLTFAEARRIMWMFTSREVYRMLVHEGGWTPDRYQRWLAETLVTTLVEPG